MPESKPIKKRGKFIAPLIFMLVIMFSGLLFNIIKEANKVKVGDAYQLIFGTTVANSKETLALMEKARGTNDYSKIAKRANNYQVGLTVIGKIIEVDGDMCKIEIEGSPSGYVSCSKSFER